MSVDTRADVPNSRLALYLAAAYAEPGVAPEHYERPEVSYGKTVMWHRYTFSTPESGEFVVSGTEATGEKARAAFAVWLRRWALAVTP